MGYNHWILLYIHTSLTKGSSHIFYWAWAPLSCEGCVHWCVNASVWKTQFYNHFNIVNFPNLITLFILLTIQQILLTQRTTITTKPTVPMPPNIFLLKDSWNNCFSQCPPYANLSPKRTTNIFFLLLTSASQQKEGNTYINASLL